MHCPLLSYYTRITLLKVIFSVFGHLVPLASRIVKILLARGTTCVYRRLLDLSPCIVLFLEYLPPQGFGPEAKTRGGINSTPRV